MIGYLLLALAICANIVTNFSLKYAIRSADVSSLRTALVDLAQSAWFWAGLLGAGVLFASFVGAIRTLPLSTAYPVLTACAIILMTTIEWAFDGVPIGSYKLAGLALTVLGIALVVQGQ